MHKRIVTGALTALITISALGATATAAPPTDYADVLKVRIDRSDPSVGYVTARYSCAEDITHLWVSVKQNDEGTADPALAGPDQGFGGGADNWLQAHPVGGFTCNGRTHVGTFEINTDEAVPPEFGGGTVGRGDLVPGSGYVQFCLTSAGNPETARVVFDFDFQRIK